MGDAILVQQVTSGGEPTISSWKQYELGAVYTSIPVGSHDRIIGLISYGDADGSTYVITVFQIAQNGAVELCDGTNKSLSIYSYGGAVGSAMTAIMAFASLTYYNGTLNIGRHKVYRTDGRAFYCTVDF